MTHPEIAHVTFAVPARASAGPARVELEIEVAGGNLTALRLLRLDVSKVDRQEAIEHQTGTTPLLKCTARQLAEYFAGERQTFDLPLPAEGTPFQRRVWDAVSQIPYGQTRSYWWVAVRMGDPRALRAVGAATAANPLPIIVPCHRVIRHDGTLGGYSTGLDWKRFLLALEGVEVPHLTAPNAVDLSSLSDRPNL